MGRLTTRNYNYELFENAVIGLDTQNSEELIMPKSLLDMVNKLQELENKIESGILIELPCKVGDKIYRIDIKTHRILQDKICKISFTDKNLIYSNLGFANNFKNYNTLCFTSKELAEAKLKELNK